MMLPFDWAILMRFLILLTNQKQSFQLNFKWKQHLTNLSFLLEVDNYMRKKRKWNSHGLEIVICKLCVLSLPSFLSYISLLSEIFFLTFLSFFFTFIRSFFFFPSKISICIFCVFDQQCETRAINEAAAATNTKFTIKISSGKKRLCQQQHTLRFCLARKYNWSKHIPIVSNWLIYFVLKDEIIGTLIIVLYCIN